MALDQRLANLTARTCAGFADSVTFLGSAHMEIVKYFLGDSKSILKASSPRPAERWRRVCQNCSQSAGATQTCRSSMRVITQVT